MVGNKLRGFTLALCCLMVVAQSYGQVWKQKNEPRQRYKECDFSVTITKDVFGYKMQIDGEGKQIRIGRIR